MCNGAISEYEWLCTNSRASTARKCGGNYRCSLLEEIGQKFRVAGGPMDHWHAKQDLLQQFLSYGASCTEVLNPKWSIQSQLTTGILKFAECFYVCRVYSLGHSANKFFAEC